MFGISNTSPRKFVKLWEFYKNGKNLAKDIYRTRTMFNIQAEICRSKYTMYVRLQQKKILAISAIITEIRIFKVLQVTIQKVM